MGGTLTFSPSEDFMSDGSADSFETFMEYFHDVGF